MYVCIYIHTYMHKYIHAYMHSFIHTHIPTFIHTYTYTYIHAYIHTYTPEPGPPRMKTTRGRSATKSADVATPFSSRSPPLCCTTVPARACMHEPGGTSARADARASACACGCGCACVHAHAGAAWLRARGARGRTRECAGAGQAHSTGHIYTGERGARGAAEAEQGTAAEAQRAPLALRRHERSQEPRGYSLAPGDRLVRPRRRSWRPHTEGARCRRSGGRAAEQGGGQAGAGAHARAGTHTRPRLRTATDLAAGGPRRRRTHTSWRHPLRPRPRRAAQGAAPQAPAGFRGWPEAPAYVPLRSFAPTPSFSFPLPLSLTRPG